MRFALAVVLIVHALIHLMGFAKAFGYAELPRLAIPISRPMGIVWLLATLLLLAAAAALWAAPHMFWVIGGVGLVVSQVAITASWSDARFGTFANVVVLMAVAYGAFAWGPFGLRAEYTRRASMARDGLPAQPASAIVEADLAPLPAPVRRYRRSAGVIGQPGVRSFRVRMTGRIRGAADAPWMPFTAEQHSFLNPPRRHFFMQATCSGLPLDGPHA